MVRTLMLLFFCLAVAGCTVEPQTSETQLSRDTWQLRVGVAGAVNRGTSTDILFRRAAELTLEQGYTHFLLSAPQTDSSVTTVGYTSYYSTGYGIGGGDPINVYRETSVVVIRMSRSSSGGALDAASVLSSLEQKGQPNASPT